jgi:hypothetical protein
MRFQRLELTSAAMTTWIVIELGETISFPTVFATATPNKNGPIKLADEAMARAALGLMALDAIIVATTFALSWKPLRKSKVKARITRMVIKVAGLI